MGKTGRLLGMLVLLASSGWGEAFQKTEIRLIGPIDYGQTSAAVRYTGNPRFSAFNFNARPGDQIEVTLEGGPGKLKVFLTNDRFEAIARGGMHLGATIPKDSAPATYYILVEEVNRQKAQFTVDLERPTRASTWRGKDRINIQNGSGN